jgi:hypothetical protein
MKKREREEEGKSFVGFCIFEVVIRFFFVLPFSFLQNHSFSLKQTFGRI